MSVQDSDEYEGTVAAPVIPGDATNERRMQFIITMLRKRLLESDNRLRTAIGQASKYKQMLDTRGVLPSEAEVDVGLVEEDLKKALLQ
ncbi:hypothetical protein KIPB_001915, partial [Kipferlia bialata]|eukprot:g1915.t1